MGTRHLYKSFGNKSDKQERGNGTVKYTVTPRTVPGGMEVGVRQGVSVHAHKTHTHTHTLIAPFRPT